MNYAKAISTLHKEAGNVFYAIWKGCLIIYNGHVALFTNDDEDSIPDVVLEKCKRCDDWNRKLDTQFTSHPRDAALFTGITFVYGTKEINVYMARKKDDTKYPFFLNKSYAEVIGKNDDIRFYGGGSPTSPAYISGLDCNALVWPTRINKHERQRLVNTINEVDRLLP